MTRSTIGATNPVDAAPGTIRGDLALAMPNNLVHGSDSPETAEREIALWFGNDSLHLYADQNVEVWTSATCRYRHERAPGAWSQEEITWGAERHPRTEIGVCP